MLDQDNEQKRNDYYVGRSFVFMQEMTNILSWRYKNFKKPEGYEKIEKLATFYAKNRKEFGTVMKNLTANSDLYKQKDLLSTKEFRSYMKRQWEILYLQNSKAEEASNNGLNMYIWSVRNTAWVLQSLYSAKREELGLLIKRDTSGQMFSPGDLLSRSKISMMYETHVHNLTLEYVGIREEIMNRLGKDIESTQRMMVLSNLKEFLSDREKLDGINVANVQTTAGTSL
jgi:dsDNA-binding SOS-regulon protein